MIPEIRNHSYSQWLKDLNLISLEQRRLRGQLIEAFQYLRRFNNVRARGLFDSEFNDRTRNNEEKSIVKCFNTSIAQHFYPIKITTTWDALPSDIVSSRTVDTFNNRLDQHWELNPPKYANHLLTMTFITTTWNMKTNVLYYKYIYISGNRTKLGNSCT